MSDENKITTVSIRERLEELLGPNLDKPVEVTPHDKWDYFKVAHDPEIGGPRAYRRDSIFDVRIVGGEAEMSSWVSFTVLKSEWHPWSEAAAELQSLMASWRARGWGAAADEVEEEIDYDMMGETVTMRVARSLPLNACRFFIDSPLRAMMASEVKAMNRAFNRMAFGEVNSRGFRIPFQPNPSHHDEVLPPGELPTSSVPPGWKRYVGVDWGRGLADLMPLQDALIDAGMLAPPESTPGADEAYSCSVERVSSADGSVAPPDTLVCLAEPPAAPSWTCHNHPPGSEIVYPATVARCEVCGQEGS